MARESLTDSMSFFIRMLFVVGLIYVLSPLRAELPDWLTNPTPESARAVTPVLAQSAAELVIYTCTSHPDTCGDLATRALTHNLPKTAATSPAAAPNTAPDPNPNTAAPPAAPVAMQKPQHNKGPQVASNDPQAALEALVRQVAAMPDPVQPQPPAAPAATPDTAPKAKAKAPAVANASNSNAAMANTVLPPLPKASATQNPLDLTIIPLPPRRKI